jgi:hypothetical protein
MAGRPVYDGRFVTMGLMSPLDLYRKLLWESKMIKELALSAGDGSIYCALNAAISAWQLGDWTAAALTNDGRWPLAAAYLGSVSMKTKADLQGAMRQCEALVACQQIATAGKHRLIKHGTFRDGFHAEHYVDYVLVAPTGRHGEKIAVRTAAISVLFPGFVDEAKTVRKQHGIERVLQDAAAWWKELFIATEYWVEDADAI